MTSAARSVTRGPRDDLRETTEGGRLGSPGVHTALSVLDAVAAGGPLALSDLAGVLATPKSSLHRICAVLVERDWLVRRLDGRFDLGIRAIGLTARSAELPIVTAFRSVSAELLTRHDETVCLAVLDGEDSVYVALEETSHPVRLVTRVGSRTPAFASASGRAILADRSPAVVAAQYAGRTLVTPTGRRLRGAEELLGILSRVRERGYAENDQETAVGLFTVSVPVRGANDAVVAAFTVCVPTSRMSPDRHDRLVRDLIASGRRLSESVAWLPAWNATRAEVHSPPLQEDG
jgi:IclR family transcriptional regulator, blcABC operon repressor